MSVSPQEQMRRKWTVAVVGGDTNLSFADWSRTTNPSRGDTFHMATTENWARPMCGATLSKWVSPSPVHDERRVNCPDCLNLLSRLAEKEGQGVGGPTPQLHTPPRMEDDNGLTDGVFIFHGTHSDLGGQMEVVPMTTGNVEFTISSDESQKDGLVFSLSHLDRADMLRALLHDFHYSPEKDGPHDN